MVVVQIIFVLFLFQFANQANSINNEEDENYKVINKLPRSPLMKYYSYSSVMILHFYIPVNTIKASFKFKAKDKPTSFFAKNCHPRNVSVHMKPGSYPVINPDGIPFPKTFLNISRPEILELTLQTDVKANYINITSPKPGDWFAVAFVSWTDPNKDRIEQQGLSSQCEAVLYSELSVVENSNIETITLNIEKEIPLKQYENELYRFFVPEDIDHILIQIEVLIPSKHSKNNILVYVKSGSVPNEENYQSKLLINPVEESKNYLWFRPEENNWQYLNISFDDLTKYDSAKEYIKLGLKLKYISGLHEEFYFDSNVTEKRINLFKTSVSKKFTIIDKLFQNSLQYKQYNLMRITGSENFIFEYDFRSVRNDSNPLFLNITSNEVTVLKFLVQEIVDIGGTLSIGLAIKPDLKPKSQKDKYFVVACLRANSLEIPMYPNLCVYNNVSSKAPIILNNTLAGTLDFLHLPYPDPGMYYLSIRAFFDECVPCNCTEECGEILQDCTRDCELNCTKNCSSCSEECVLDILECQDCNCDGNCLKTNDTNKNTSVIFSISSFPCITGTCGQKGICNHYMAGGFIFSSCYCKGGYRGWDCSDGSQALSDTEILLTILLLTLSNVLFIPSIYFAYKRRYYTEAVTYFCTMFASTFYHACDSKENNYGFCIFPLGVLQFCDFYCGLLTIWVTLIAISYINGKFVSTFHIAGAIILAFSVTYNKHALWVFILPAVFGVLLIALNWGLTCKKTKQLFPAKKYLKIYMPIGAALVFMGLISFAFLETKENYKFVHSLWHVVMAVSIIFLLPNDKTFVPKT